MKKIISFFLTYLLLAIGASFAIWILTNGIITNIKSIPESIIQGYENPYLSILGMYLIFLFLTFVIYKLVIAVSPKNLNTKAKVLIGIISGFLPITIGYVTTFGFPTTSAIDLSNIVFFSISGGLIPVIERRIVRSHEK